jgi:hypothetical protein
MSDKKHHFKILNGKFSMFGLYHLSYPMKNQFSDTNDKESKFYGIDAFHGHSFSHSFPK